MMMLSATQDMRRLAELTAAEAAEAAEAAGGSAFQQ